MYAPAYETGRPGPVWEQGIAVVWFIVGTADVPFAAPLRYLCALYFVGVFGWYYRHFLPAALKVWPIFLVPIWGASSFMWSEYPNSALRGGILQILTFVIIVVLAHRLTLPQLFRCLLISGIAMAVYAFIHPWRFEAGAQFGHKNPLSINMAITFAICLWAALDQKVPTWQRGLGALFVPICAFIVLNANSATGLVMMAFAGAAIAGARFAWVDLARVENLRIVLTIAAAATMLVGLLIVAGLPVGQVFSQFLAGLGKDATLTGRTDLWNFADIASDEKPWLGHGVMSFWQSDVGLAQTINAFSFKPAGTVFSFHNAFLEARVHIGYIGLSLFIFSVLWAVSRVVRQWIKNQDMICSLAIVLVILVLITSMTESWLWSQFNTQMHLFYLPAIAAFGASYRRYLGEALITETTSEVPGGHIQLVTR